MSKGTTLAAKVAYSSKRSEKLANRKNLLAELKKCRLQPLEQDRIISTTKMQTKGLKRFLKDEPHLNQIECIPMIQKRWQRKKSARKRTNKPTTSSSSEDTDAISTDTEIYTMQSPTRIRCETPEKNTDNHINDIELTTSVTTAATATTTATPIMAPREPAIFVPVVRDSLVEKSRLELPIIGEEQTIMESIRYNDVVIISGETGSGKTTQIPQFLYEGGYALNGKIIGITEPRRVAAVSMSERVARELNLSSNEVSYQIRFSGNITDNTKIKFMTDGVLLRECQQDFLLTKYSVLIIDEAHERSVFSDILIGLLSRIVPMRAKRGNPLKLVIMSATLKVSDFTMNSFLFKQTPPLINIEARQYPVTVQFASRTPDSYLQAAYKKVCSIHSKMPTGGILVFVTSQMDVKVLCRKLKEKFSRDKLLSNGQFREEWSDIDSNSEDDEGTASTTCTPLHCLGLYAMLPLEKQRLVFRAPPDGTRLCVVATNVAETSITIPNIKYVIDTGKEKTKVYNLSTGVSRLITTWTSKSSAEQRMGRAGRMGPGYCYRLYSSAVFTNDFAEYAEPRILQKPFEDILLQMKSMNIDNVVNFPFPTRPSLEALMTAEKKLIMLGALDDSEFKNARFADINKTEFSSRITPLGRGMARFPVGARCSKMLILSPPDLLPHVISLVSALTVREMFLDGNKWRDIRKKWAGHGNLKRLGDFMVMIRAVCAADSFKCSNKLCLENGMRTKAMLEIDKLRKQLTHDINKKADSQSIEFIKILKKPTQAQSNLLRQLLLSSYCDHIARKLPDGNIVEKDPDDPNKTRTKRLRHAYQCKETEEPVYISSESVLKGQHPDFLVYKELYQGDKKMYMRDVAVIESAWIADYSEKIGFTLTS